MTLEKLLLHGSAFQTVHSAAILIVLLVCSIVVLATIVERALYFRGTGVDIEKTLLKLGERLRSGKPDEALKDLGNTRKSPVLAVVEAGIRNRTLPPEEYAKMLRACQMRQRDFMERRLNVLGTLGSTAPFIGLLGTVLGIIQAFQDLASPQAASEGASIVAVGIAEALVATAAGLMVAIPAVVFYNYFLKRVKGLMAEMEIAALELSVLFSLK